MLRSTPRLLGAREARHEGAGSSDRTAFDPSAVVTEVGFSQAAARMAMRDPWR